MSTELGGSWSHGQGASGWGTAGRAHCRRWTAAAFRMSRSVRGELGFRASRSIRRLLQKWKQDPWWNLLEGRGGPTVPRSQGRTQAAGAGEGKTFTFPVCWRGDRMDKGPEAGCLALAGTKEKVVCWAGPGVRMRKHLRTGARAERDILFGQRFYMVPVTRPMTQVPG